MQGARSVPEGRRSIRVDVDGPVATVLLSRPARLNALSLGLLTELADVVEAFSQDDAVQVLVLAADGRTFSAGADIDEIRAGAEDADPIERVTREARLGARLCDALEDPRLVTVVAVQGYAVGGAAAMIAACDLRLLADDARIVVPELAMGVPLAWGGVERLVRDLGQAVVRDLLLTGRDLAADEALGRGFATEVVPRDSLAERARAVAELVATRPAFATTTVLRRVLAVSSRTDAPGLDDDAATLGRAAAHPDAIAATRAYLRSLDDRAAAGAARQETGR